MSKSVYIFLGLSVCMYVLWLVDSRKLASGDICCLCVPWIAQYCVWEETHAEEQVP